MAIWSLVIIVYSVYLPIHNAPGKGRLTPGILLLVVEYVPCHEPDYGNVGDSDQGKDHSCSHDILPEKRKKG